MSLIEQLNSLAYGVVDSEGYKPRSYNDSKGNRTIGVGFNMDRPGAQEDMLLTLGVNPDRFSRLYAGEDELSDEEIQKLLDRDLFKSDENVRRNLPWVENAPPSAREALTEMDFQMGTKGMLGFPDTIAAIKAGEYEEAKRLIALNEDGTGPSGLAIDTPARLAKYQDLFDKAAGEVQTEAEIAVETAKVALVGDVAEPTTETEVELLDKISNFGSKHEYDDPLHVDILKSAQAVGRGPLGQLMREGMAGGVDMFGKALQGTGALIDNLFGDEDGPDARVKDNPLEIIGEDIEGLAKIISPEGPTTLLGEVGRGGGTMIAGMASAITGGPLAAGGLFSAQYYDSLYDQAIEGGATPEDAEWAANFAPLLGAGEMVPLERILRFSKVVPNEMRAQLMSAAKNGTVEGVQEVLASIAETTIVNEVVREEAKREIFNEEQIKEGGIGFALGAVMDAAIPGRTPGSRTQEDILTAPVTEGAVAAPAVGDVALDPAGPVIEETADEAVQQSEVRSDAAEVQAADAAQQEERLLPEGAQEVAPEEDAERTGLTYEEEHDAMAPRLEEIASQYPELTDNDKHDAADNVEDIIESKPGDPGYQAEWAELYGSSLEGIRTDKESEAQLPEPEIIEDADGELVEIQRDEDTHTTTYLRGGASLATTIREETGDVVLGAVAADLQDKEGRAGVVRAVVDQALADGRNVVSDTALSVADNQAFKNLRRQGYSIQYNPHTKRLGPSGVKADGWVYKITKDVQKDPAVVSGILDRVSDVRDQEVYEARDELLSNEQLELRDVFRSAFGREIVYTEGNSDLGFVNPQNPAYIFVRADQKQPVATVASHELLHTIQASRPDLYKSLKETLEGEISGLPLAERVEKPDFLGRGKKPAVRQEEAVADFMGVELFTEQNLAALKETNPEKFTQLSTYVRRWWDGVLEKMRNMATALKGRAFFVEEAQAARDEMVRVLNEASKRPASLQAAIDARQEPEAVTVEETVAPEPVIEEEIEVEAEEIVTPEEELLESTKPEELSTDERTEEEVFNEEVSEEEGQVTEAPDEVKTLGKELEAKREYRNILRQKLAEKGKKEGRGLIGRLWKAEQGRRSKGRTDALMTRRDPVEREVMRQRGLKMRNQAHVAARMAQIRVALNQVTNTQDRKNAESTVREWIKATPKQRAGDPSLVNRYSALPADVKTQVTEFDARRKELEEWLVKEGVVTPRKLKDVNEVSLEELLESMTDEAFAQYARTEYKVFDYSGTAHEWLDVFQAKSPDVWQDVAQFLESKQGIKYAKAHGIKSEDADTMAFEILHNLMGVGTEGGARAASDITSRDVSALKKKDNIHPLIRALLGERIEPEFVMARTIGVMVELQTDWQTSANIAQMVFMENEAVMEEDVKLRDEHKGWERLDPSAPNENHPFAGVFVRPEVYSALRDPDGLAEAGRRATEDQILLTSGKRADFFGMNAARYLGQTKWLARLNSYSKSGLILGNPPSYVLNMLSVVPLTWTSGTNSFQRIDNQRGTRQNILSASLADAVLLLRHKNAVKDGDHAFIASLSQEQRDRVDEILEQNLVDEAALTEEMLNQLREMVDAETKDPNDTRAWHEKVMENPAILTNLMKQGVDYSIEKAGGFFSMFDTAARIAVYHSEKAVLDSAGVFMSESALRTEAGLRARSGYLTYSRIPLIAKAMNNFPSSAFLSFTVSLYQTALNNQIQAHRDMKYAKEIADTNPEGAKILRRHATSKMALNSGLHLFGVPLITMAVQAALDAAGWGGDEEDKKLHGDIRDPTRASWNQGRQHVYWKRDGEIYETNTTDLIPFAPGNMLMTGIARVAEKLADGEEIDVTDELELMLSPLLDPLVKSKSPGVTGARAIADLLQGDWEEAKKKAKAIQPGFMRVIPRLAGMQGEDKQYRQAIGMLTGRTPSKQDPVREGGFKAAEYFKESSKTRRKMYGDVLNEDGVSDEEVRDAFSRYIVATKEEQDSLKEVIVSLEAQGASRKEITDLLVSRARLSKTNARKLMRGKYGLTDPDPKTMKKAVGVEKFVRYRSIWREVLREE